MQVDPLQDPDVVAAMRIIGRRAPAGRHPCPRCSSSWIRESEEMCRNCAIELREADLEHKRRYARRRQATDATAIAGAKTWLRWQLRKGPRPSSQIMTNAREDGIARSTLHRARAQLEVLHRRVGNGPDHSTWWALPQHATRLTRVAGGTSGGGDTGDNEEG